MSWKFVFNSSLTSHDRDGAKNLAQRSGYLFYTWNDEVLLVNDNTVVMMVKDLF